MTHEELNGDIVRRDVMLCCVWIYGSNGSKQEEAERLEMLDNFVVALVCILFNDVHSSPAGVSGGHVSTRMRNSGKTTARMLSVGT